MLVARILLCIAVTQAYMDDVIDTTHHHDESLEAVKSELVRRNLPGVAFITGSEDQASKMMKHRINNNPTLLALLDQFVVVNPQGQEAMSWTFPGDDFNDYIPRVYFLDQKGEFINHKGSKSAYPRLFSHANDISAILHKVLNSCSIEPSVPLEEPEIIPAATAPPAVPKKKPQPPPQPVKPAEPEPVPETVVEAAPTRMRGGASASAEIVDEAEAETSASEPKPAATSTEAEGTTAEA